MYHVSSIVRQLNDSDYYYYFIIVIVAVVVVVLFYALRIDKSCLCLTGVEEPYFSSAVLGATKDMKVNV